MPNTLRIKRRATGGGAGAPSGLANAELAYNEQTNILYYGWGTGGAGGTATQAIPIAGSGSYTFVDGSNANGIWPISINGNSATVTSGVYTNRTLTAGSGLVGGGDLSADRTFNIGKGDGINVAADSISVDSSVMRTTGGQTIGEGGSAFTTTIKDNLIIGDITHNNGDGYLLITGEGFNTAEFSVTNISLSRNTSINGTLSVTGNLTVSGTGLLASNINNFDTQVRTSRLDQMSAPTADVSFNSRKITSLAEPTVSTDAATKNYVDGLLSANDAMVFKGTIGTGGTVTALPTTHSAGWSYRVITANTYAGKVCEVGDLIIAVVDRSGSSNTNDDWTVAQTNIDGAVVGPASSTDNALAVFDGATGKLLKNSSFVPTTVGGNLINLSNPSAVTFLRVNADNTVTTLSDSNFRTAIGVNDATLTLNVSGTGLSGSQTFTANQSSNATFTVTSNATPANTASAIVARDSSGNFSAGTITANLNGNATTVTSGVYTNDSRLTDTRNTTNSLTVNNAGAGTASPFTFNGSSAQTLSYNSIGAPSISGANATGTWNISVTGNAGTVTNGVYTSRTVTAGSGLVGGGDLSADRTFNIGQGDGISVSADAVAVDTTVVRTTGAQAIGGTKTLTSQLLANSGIVIGDTLNYLTGTALAINFGDSGGQLASFTNAASSFNNTIKLNATTTFNRVDEAGSLPFIISPTGYAGSGAVMQGYWRGTAVEVDKGGTGRTSYSNGQLLIGSGTSLAPNTLTAGSGISVTNGSGTIAIDVNNTVIRTTGDQVLTGDKQFRTPLYAVSGIVINGYVTWPTRYGNQLDIAYQVDNGFYLAQFNTSSNANLNFINLNAVTTFDKVSSDGALPFVISPTGYAGSGAVTQGFWRGTAVEVDKGGTGQTSYTNGQLLIGNSTGNTLTKAALTPGTGIAITNGAGSITVAHGDTSPLLSAGAIGTSGISSITVDDFGHIQSVSTATYLTQSTLCAALDAANCTIDGGTF